MGETSDTAFRKLDGPSASAFGSAFLFSSVGTLLALACLWIGAVLRDSSRRTHEWGSWQSSLYLAIVVILVSVGLLTIVTMVLAFQKTNAELGAGYSTALYQKAPVAVLDPKTGFVLRTKDQPAFRDRRDVAAARKKVSAGR